MNGGNWGSTGESSQRSTCVLLSPAFQFFGRQRSKELQTYSDLTPECTGLPITTRVVNGDQDHHGLLSSCDDNFLAFAGLFDQPGKLRLRPLDGDRFHTYMLADSTSLRVETQRLNERINKIRRLSDVGFVHPPGSRPLDRNPAAKIAEVYLHLFR